MKELNDKELEKVAGGQGTGAGIAAWAMNAYTEGWSYVWGGAIPGSVDASGLIYSYVGGARTTEAMFSSAAERGPIASMPEIPGIGLYQPGHVGVYVGSGMCVHAANEQSGVVCESVSDSGWIAWFRIPGVKYDA